MFYIIRIRFWRGDWWRNSSVRKTTKNNYEGMFIVIFHDTNNYRLNQKHCRQSWFWTLAQRDLQNAWNLHTPVYATMRRALLTGVEDGWELFKLFQCYRANLVFTLLLSFVWQYTDSSMPSPSYIRSFGNRSRLPPFITLQICKACIFKVPNAWRSFAFAMRNVKCECGGRAAPLRIWMNTGET